MRIRNILLPTDFSPTAQNAFRHAMYMADQTGANLQLLHVVIPEVEGMDMPVLSAKATEEKMEIAKIALKAFAEEGLAQMEASGMMQSMPIVSTDVEIGTILNVIRQVIEAGAVDMVVMGTKGKHNFLEKVFGSIASGVVSSVACPVLVIPEDAPVKKISKAAFATQLMEGDMYHIWETVQILQNMHSVLHCLHIKTAQEEKTEVSIKDLRDFFNKQTPLLQMQFHEIEGETVVDELERFIEYHEMDLLAMYAPSHTVIDKILRKSHTRRLCFESNIPLLIMKKK